MASYRFTVAFGNNTFMAPCAVVLLQEIQRAVELGLLSVTNLGQIGDARHQAEPGSRHNPALSPDGKWLICAADFGGRDYQKLALFFQYLYKRKDPRVYRYGFSQRGDGTGITWFSGEWKWTGNDLGHAHLDFAMSSASLGRGTGWWVPALNDTSPWGLVDWLRTGGVSDGLDDESIDNTEGFLMALTDQQQSDILAAITRLDGDRQWTTPAINRLDAELRQGAAPQRQYRADNDTAVYRSGVGVWEHIKDEAEQARLVATGRVSPTVVVVKPAELEQIRKDSLAGAGGITDEQSARMVAAIAAAVRTAGTSSLDDNSIARMVAATVQMLRDQPITFGAR